MLTLPFIAGQRHPVTTLNVVSLSFTLAEALGHYMEGKNHGMKKPFILAVEYATSILKIQFASGLGK
jgi:hypothetical protein